MTRKAERAVWVFLLCLAGAKELHREKAGVKHAEKCQWQNHPDSIFPRDNWSCVVGDEVIGDVWKTQNDFAFSAFHLGAFCGVGEFTTLEAAKRCVESYVK